VALARNSGTDRYYIDAYIEQKKKKKKKLLTVGKVKTYETLEQKKGRKKRERWMDGIDRSNRTRIRRNPTTTSIYWANVYPFREEMIDYSSRDIP
jgi:hypothetical protein